MFYNLSDFAASGQPGLIETALRDIGVEPTVITSPDSLQGAEPLTHSTCYILKLHGDYKDARILNTDEELSVYPDDYNTMLDRILDEHGLVVCGWSGEWDHALRAAIERAPNRRYPIFWASRGDLRGRGAELCSARKGVTVSISDANTFFGTLVEQVDTLAQLQRRNPISVDMLVSRAKRYLSKQEHRIQLADLMSEEVERIISRLDQDDIVLRRPIDDDDILRRFLIYEEISEGLSKVCGAIGRWGEPSQMSVVADALRAILSIANANQSGELTKMEPVEMRQYPAVLAYHACTLGLQCSEKWSELHEFMGLEVQDGCGASRRLVEVAGPSVWECSREKFWRKLPGMDSIDTPFHDHLADQVIANWGSAFLPSRAPLAEITLLNEALTAIRFFETNSLVELKIAKNEIGRDLNRIWTPVGRAGRSRDYQERIVPQIVDANSENNWPRMVLVVVAKNSFLRQWSTMFA